MELNKHDIAERFAALAPGKQKEFLAALKKRGLDFSLLPILPQKGENGGCFPMRSRGTGSYGSSNH